MLEVFPFVVDKAVAFEDESVEFTLEQFGLMSV